MAINFDALWNFDNPALSRERFKALLTDASKDDAFMLQTQIARTFGLAGDFTSARATLAAIELERSSVSPEAQVRFDLESGRTFASAVHNESSGESNDASRARFHYQRAIDVAHAHRLDALEIDALHMFGFVETEPALQRAWAQKALAVALSSDQEAAKRWQASLRNNIGYSLHEEGRFDEALAQFEAALRLREERGDARATGIARWMVAWTLRSLKRFDEAIEIQSGLERQYDATGTPSVYVYEELAALYRATGHVARSEAYSLKAKALTKEST